MDQPPWIANAWAELGQREVAGSSDNPHIRIFFRDAGASGDLHDEVPWCAAFVGACLERAGVASTRSLMARSYVRWGAALEQGRCGAVAVLSRGGDPSAGHVGFLVGETQSHVLLLGGNQGDAVSVAPFAKSRLLGLRWPAQATSATAVPSNADGEFDRALAHVLEMEGGYTDDPYDPGGPTNRGITLRVYAEWKRTAADASLRDELRHIADADVRALYAARYWAPAGCDHLPAALAFFHFDAAVNHGVTGAIRLLQQAVGTDVDGEIGPLTLAAIAARPLDQTLNAYAEARRRRYRALAHFWRFGRGWLRRVDTALERALNIPAAPAAAASPQSPSQSTSQQKGPSPMAASKTDATPTTKWWGSSLTIWGALITALSTVLPALGPVVGIDITSDLVHQLGDQIVTAVQAIGGLIGTLLTIYGRMRASGPLERRDVSVKL